MTTQSTGSISNPLSLTECKEQLAKYNQEALDKLGYTKEKLLEVFQSFTNTDQIDNFVNKANQLTDLISLTEELIDDLNVASSKFNVNKAKGLAEYLTAVIKKLDTKQITSSSMKLQYALKRVQIEPKSFWRKVDKNESLANSVDISSDLSTDNIFEMSSQPNSFKSEKDKFIDATRAKWVHISLTGDLAEFDTLCDEVLASLNIKTNFKSFAGKVIVTRFIYGEWLQEVNSKRDKTILDMTADDLLENPETSSLALDAELRTQFVQLQKALKFNWAGDIARPLWLVNLESFWVPRIKIWETRENQNLDTEAKLNILKEAFKLAQHVKDAKLAIEVQQEIQRLQTVS